MHRTNDTDTHFDRAARTLSGWCSFALSMVLVSAASAALGCGGGGGSDPVQQAVDDLSNNDDLQGALNDLADSFDQDDVDADDLDDILDQFNDDDGDGIPDLPDDLPDDFDSILPPSTTVAGSFSGSGTGLSACDNGVEGIDSSSTSVSVTLDGSGNATFTVERTSTSFGITVTTTETGASNCRKPRRTQSWRFSLSWRSIPIS